MFSRRMLTKCMLGLSLLAATPTGSFAQAGADLNVSPKRIVFSAETRSSTVLVFNRGGSEVTYNIDLVDRVMTPDGQIISVADAAAKPEAASVAKKVASATALINFTPRRVTLKPGDSQTIRIRVLRPPELAAGEYRTHLTITAAPPEDTGLTAEQAVSASDGKVAVRLVTVFSISIPLIVRQGGPDVGATITDVKYLDAEPAGGALSLQLTRKGASSLFGDVEVRPAGAPRATVPLGLIRGVGVYPEIDRRLVQFKLSRALVRGEHLDIVFRDDDTRSGETLAAVPFTVP